MTLLYSLLNASCIKEDLLILMEMQMFPNSVWTLPILWHTIFRNVLFVFCMACYLFFVWLYQISFYASTDWYEAKESKRHLCKFMELSLQGFFISEIWSYKFQSPYSPQTWISVSSVTETTEFYSNLVPASWFRNSLQAEIHGIHIVHLVSFSSLRDYGPMLLFVQHLKTIVSYIVPF